MPGPAATKSVMEKGDRKGLGLLMEQEQPIGPFGNSEVLAFHRALGNRAVGQLLQGGANSNAFPLSAAPTMVQAKESNGQPNNSAADRSEQTPAPEPTTPARRLI